MQYCLVPRISTKRADKILEVIVHEMGHTMVLDHSGLRSQDADKLAPQKANAGLAEYEDNSCMMGEPIISSDTVKCACNCAALNVASLLNDAGCCAGGDGAQQVRTGL